MDELTEQILAEKENVDIALQNLKTALARNEKTVIELAAIATFLHNIYNGIENILKQILISREIIVPKSVHAYGFMLDEKELEGLSNHIPEIWHQFLKEIRVDTK